MSKSKYYILSHGKLIRKQNNLYFIKAEDEKTKKITLPIKKIESLYIFGRVSLGSGAVHYLLKENIPIYFFNKYGVYLGSLVPKSRYLSGFLLVKQVEHYLDKEKRLYLARKFVIGAINNMIRNLAYYSKKSGSLEGYVEKLKKLKSNVLYQKDIPSLMATEGEARKTYYESFDLFLPEDFRFEKRTKRPPRNMLNALISFGNSLLYAAVLTEIYQTQLNPTISYLHEPFERRYSLNLDISEVFKPLIVDRVIFKLLNKKMITKDHFIKEINYCVLNDKGKRIFIKEFEEKLKTTIKHRDLGRKVSYKRLIRLECYKLIKHFLGMRKYEPFRIWW